MKRIAFTIGLILLLSCAIVSQGETSKTRRTKLSLKFVQGLEVVGGKAEITAYRGRRAVHLLSLPNHPAQYDLTAIVGGTDFKDGTIEIEVAGFPGKEADAENRGFVGLGFHVQEHGSRGEYFYLRPTNARAEDQLRRNHSVQYVSKPEFPWRQLRTESPGVYESYADLEPGVWTKMKIEVSGTKARLYVNRATQPCLVINDLKLGETHGQIALWAYGGVEAYFSNLTVR